ncbi:unnamed protein product [marine sediment metagenome]|uniref:Uncharacterized protein n=1 Tax=marine sediment metagenome TaxID=412755 RepID=X1CSN4_9ZZZZ
MKAILKVTYKIETDKDGKEYLKGVSESGDWDAFKKVFVIPRYPDKVEVSFK